MYLYFNLLNRAHFEMQNSLIAYVTASDPFQFAQLDLCNADTLSTTRITCLRINLSELRPFVEDGESAVEWIGEWITQGPASASGAFHCPTDDNPGMIYSGGIFSFSRLRVLRSNLVVRAFREICLRCCSNKLPAKTQ